MNWNIFNRFRAIEQAQLAHALAISALLNRVKHLELPSKPDVEKLLKAQAYRKAYYQKRKAALKAAND